MTMILRLSGLLIGACLFTQLQAQDTQYIVKLNRDTIRGKLQINPIRDNSTSMFFKGEDGSKEYIRPLRVTFVYHSEDYQFRSVAFYNQRLFMQIIKEDEHISYYNYIHKRDNSIMTTKVVAKPNGETIELSGLTFRKQVTEFLEDCPEIIAKLEAKQYRYKDYEQLFADYNECLQQPSVKPFIPTTVRAKAAVIALNTSAVETTLIPIDDTMKERITKIDEFRKYVTTLQNFTYTNDVLEWLSDVEQRISQNREIPNYLWNSLNAMAEERPELQGKAMELKKGLEN